MDLTWLHIGCYVFFLIVAGYILPFIKKKIWARTLAWTIAIVTVSVSAVVTSGQSSLVSMLVVVVLQLLSMKIIVAVESYSGENRLTVLQWLAFSLGWFGMRPVLFERLPSRPLLLQGLAVKGISRVIIGFSLLYLSRLVDGHSTAAVLFLPQLLLLAGLSFILHFGILNLSAASWRFAGVDAPELFRSPYRSTSLKEFWGRRWNVAFSEMTALIVYRPLKGKLGAEIALATSFFLSGLLHEIAISLPVRSGYGLPMLYFAIHAAAMQMEARSSVVQKLLGHRILRHVWVMTVLILPMPLLFHKAFIDDVLIPLREVILSCC